MKIIFFFVLGALISLFVNDYMEGLDKLDKIEARISAPTPKPENKKLVYAGSFENGITLWVDKEHNVACYIYEAGVGSTSHSGLSCLPGSQVMGTGDLSK